MSTKWTFVRVVYSEENMRHLRAAAERMEAGKNVVHDIIEGDDV